MITSKIFTAKLCLNFLHEIQTLNGISDCNFLMFKKLNFVKQNSWVMVTLTLYKQAMVTHGRVELLAHPLSQKYLQMKWNSYGKYFHLANLLFYSIFLIFVTIFSSQLMKSGIIVEHKPAYEVYYLKFQTWSLKTWLLLKYSCKFFPGKWEPKFN